MNRDATDDSRSALDARSARARRRAVLREVVAGLSVLVAVGFMAALGWLVHDTATRGSAQLEVHPHIVAAVGAPAVRAAKVSFTFDGRSYSIRPHVSGAVYRGASESTRSLVRTAEQTDRQWSDAYFECFTGDPAQQPAIDDVVAQLRAIKRRAGMGGDTYLELIAKYVQSIPYDDAQVASGTLRQRFPVETLVEGTGLCGDKSVLLAVLLAHEGYSAALLEFPAESHMAVGVKGRGHTYRSSGWLFLETTAPTYVTDVPETYAGGMKLTSKPRVHRVGSGTREYGSASDISRIVRARDGAEKAASRLYASAKARPLTVAEAQQVNRKLDIARTATISLRSNVFDDSNRPVGEFMDRAQALRWIARNVWW